MGLLINDELIWISIPRCASVSIENALLNSNLIIKQLPIDARYKNRHMHFKKSQLYQEFGIHETLCIKRDWFDRWISGLYQLFSQINLSNIYTTIIPWENIDNDFIYNTFDDDFANSIYVDNTENWDNSFLRVIKESSLRDKLYDFNGNIVPDISGILSALLSQNHYKENTNPDYEFDISEIDKFSDFIYNKFGERLQIKKLNESKPTPNKIILDDKLKQWVWDKFENRFEKRNQLI
jgi:hypothetical protein